MQATLTTNDSAKFEDKWIYLKPSNSKCLWARGIKKVIHLPIAHGEGKFIPKDKSILKGLWDNKQVVFQYYRGNPNGSVDDIAGVCDTTGRIFGLMPHPERHFSPTHHPRWMREGLQKQGDGAIIFKNGISYARRLL
jgi:phosphoribosylformylglycinamidine synthase